MAGYEKVTVIGAGLMGHAIALVHAMAGCEVTLCDLSQERLDWARARLEDLAQSGNTGVAEAPEALARIGYAVDLAGAVAGADLVVEAIVEDAEAKRALFDQLAGLVRADAVIASNTSFLDIFPLVPQALSSRTLIVHWYTPPYLIDLVDVVPAPEADPGLAARMVEFLRAMGKKPVLLRKFVPGYIANNVQMAIEAEVFRLLDAGVAEVGDIDDAIRFGLAQRLCLMGQFRKIDYTGLQVVRDIHAAGLYTPPVQPTGTSRLDSLLAEGASGLLAGRGFYDYDAAPSDYLDRRDRNLLRLRAALEGLDDGL